MKLKYEFVVTEVAGEHVAVPVGKGAEELSAVLRLNETAAEILNCLQQDTDIEAIVSYLADNYEATHERLFASVEQFVALLREKDLLDE